MAFVDEGGLGTATSKTASTTLAITTTQDAFAGQLVVIVTAWDNNNTATVTGPFDEFMEATDPNGTLYQMLAGAQEIGTGAANTGEACYILAGILPADLASGSTITLNYASKTAKAATLRLFSIDSPHIAIGARMHLHNSDADLTISDLYCYEWLFLWGCASEGPSTDTITEDADYTEITKAGTTGSADDTNMTAIGAFRIRTTDSETFDLVTGSGRGRTYLFLAIREYDAGDDPDHTAVIDTFDAANANPLPSPWTNALSLGSQRVSNIARGIATTNTSASARDDNLGEFYEVGATISALMGATDDRSVGVLCNGGGLGNSATADFYLCLARNSGFGIHVGLWRVINGGGGMIGCAWNGQDVAVSDKLAVRTRGDILEAWWYDASATTWHLMAAVYDTSIGRTEYGGVYHRRTGGVGGAQGGDLNDYFGSSVPDPEEPPECEQGGDLVLLTTIRYYA